MKAVKLPVNYNNSQTGKSPKNPTKKTNRRCIKLIVRFIRPTEDQLDVISNSLLGILNSPSNTFCASNNFQSKEAYSND